MTAIYHYNATSGAYSGESLADESPLEKGVFLIPAHATTLPPPNVNTGEYAVWAGNKWEVRRIPVETPKQVSLGTTKAAKDTPAKTGVLDPVAKLRQFLLDNPDVLALLK